MRSFELNFYSEKTWVNNSKSTIFSLTVLLLWIIIKSTDFDFNSLMILLRPLWVYATMRTFLEIENKIYANTTIVNDLPDAGPPYTRW